RWLSPVARAARGVACPRRPSRARPPLDPHRLLDEARVMSPTRYVLAIDQGTTSSRAILFDSQARAVALARRDLKQHYPASGWVEHDPEDLWRDTLAAVREVIERS